MRLVQNSCVAYREYTVQQTYTVHYVCFLLPTLAPQTLHLQTQQCDACIRTFVYLIRPSFKVTEVWLLQNLAVLLPGLCVLDPWVGTQEDIQIPLPQVQLEGLTS